ncbi:hypothetical protein COP1_036590 [Malus domestica]
MSTRYYDRSWWGRGEPIYATTCPRHSKRWTNNAGGLVDYRPGCQGLVKHSTAGIIMEHINGLVIDNVNMRWSDDPFRQWNDPLDFRSATVNNISLLNFHSSLYKQ